MVFVAILEYFIIAFLMWGIIPTLHRGHNTRHEILWTAFWPVFVVVYVGRYYLTRARYWMKRRY